MNVFDDVGVISLAWAWAVIRRCWLMIGIAHVTGGAEPEYFAIRMPGFVKAGIDMLAGPVIYFCGSVGLFVAVIWFRE